ncbi:MAG TPA: enoyl-CoA hydratase/isomerase family protein [Candidatus Sulfotelmatobacter sp.]|nr:enoyl-CoA hydratase/isomerase family protein [Candidatus Sulfotelmatobacter sp.]
MTAADIGNEFTLRHEDGILFLTLASGDGMNRLTRRKVIALQKETEGHVALDSRVPPLIISGTPIFSAGADLSEISQLGGPDALVFAKMGQELMNTLANYPAPVYASIYGFCLGGGLDLALACRHRIASPHAVLGHRGAALGLITGWGGTQRLPRLIGKGRALEMFVSAEKVSARQALDMGLVDAVVDDPVAEAVRRILE